MPCFVGGHEPNPDMEVPHVIQFDCASIPVTGFPGRLPSAVKAAAIGLLVLFLAPAAVLAAAATSPKEAGSAAAGESREARHAKIVAGEKTRAANMRAAIERARKLVDEAKAAGHAARIPLLERKLAILVEKDDLLKQVAGFRQERWEAETARNGDGIRAADAKTKAAYAIIQSRQDEEKALQKQLDAQR